MLDLAVGEDLQQALPLGRGKHDGVAFKLPLSDLLGQFLDRPSERIDGVTAVLDESALTGPLESRRESRHVHALARGDHPRQLIHPAEGGVGEGGELSPLEAPRMSGVQVLEKLLRCAHQAVWIDAHHEGRRGQVVQQRGAARQHLTIVGEAGHSTACAHELQILADAPAQPVARFGRQVRKLLPHEILYCVRSQTQLLNTAEQLSGRYERKRGEVTSGALVARVEAPEGVHLVPEELDANGLAIRGGVDIDDEAPYRVLPRLRHHVDAAVARLGQPFDEPFAVGFLPSRQAPGPLEEAFLGHDIMEQGRRRCDDDACQARREFGEDPQPVRLGLRVNAVALEDRHLHRGEEANSAGGEAGRDRLMQAIGDFLSRAQNQDGPTRCLMEGRDEERPGGGREPLGLNAPRPSPEGSHRLAEGRIALESAR